MYRSVDKYKKNPSLLNLQIFEICKIVPKVVKCADSWRNTEKSEFVKFEICKIISKFTKCADSWRNITEQIQVGDPRHLRNSR